MVHAHGGRRTIRCITCKRRKVKCDAQQPRCGPCQARGIQCEGYNFEVVFVHEASSPSAYQVAQVHRPAHANPGARRRQAFTCIRSLLPDEDTVFKSHFLSRLSSSESNPSSLMGVLARLTTMDMPDKSLQQSCVTAMTASYYGNIYRNQQTSTTGIRAYGRAVAKLNRALNHHDEVFHTETLMSVLCLCLYENIVVTDPMAWQNHYDGVSQLIKLRGPGRHQSGIERDILHACRYMIIVSAGMHRRHCYLSEPAWKAATWPAGHDEARSKGSSLLDIVADVPGLLSDLDACKADNLSGEALTDLRQRTACTLQALQDWMPTSPSGHPSAKDTTPAYSQTTAAAVAFRHSILLYMEELCEFLSLPLPPLPPKVDEATRQPPASDCINPQADVKQRLAGEVYSLALSSIHNQNSIPGAFFFILPLHIAQGHLDLRNPEARQRKEDMEKIIAEDHGFRIGRTPTASSKQ